MNKPFRYFKTSPEIIRLAVLMYVRFPLSLRQVEDLLHERGIDVSYETVRFWWNWFGPVVAAEIRKKRSTAMRATPQWRWHLDEVFVRINGNTHYLWRAVDHEGEVLETFVTKKRDRRAALNFIKKTMKRYGSPEVIVTDKLRSYRAAMTMIGKEVRQETKRWFNNRAENSHQPFRKKIILSENERWQSSEIINHCRNLSQFIHPFTIISTWNLTFIIVKASNPIARKR